MAATMPNLSALMMPPAVRVNDGPSIPQRAPRLEEGIAIQAGRSSCARSTAGGRWLSAREADAMSIAGELARFLTSTNVNDLPPRALERARMVIASTIASAAMGSDIVSSQIIRELAKERGGAEEATLWFDGERKLPVADAARVNAVMSDAAASDDR